MPNPQSNKEPAEGSRETVTDGREHDQAGGEQPDRDNAGGITNRPLDREQQEQQEVPPRGKRKDEES